MDTPTHRTWSFDVFIAAVAACVAGIANDFANDDIALIGRNVRVHHLMHARDWFTLPYWPPPFSPDLYRPVTTMLLAIEYTIGGGSPMVFRLVSYVLYALVSVGVFALATRVLSRPVAMGAGFLFAAHPVHVEATALAVGQAELLMALISLVMVVRYIDARRLGVPTTREWMLLAVLYFIACLTKEQGLLIPALLVAAELLLVRRPWRELRGGVVLILPALAALAIRRAVLGDIAGSFTAEALDGVAFGGRVLTFLAIVPQWARLLFWPARLSVDYSPQEIVASTHVGTPELLGVGIVLAVVAAAWRLARRAPVFSFGTAWAALMLFPVSNLLVVTGVVLAERTLFSPSIGVVLAMAGLCELVMTSRQRSPTIQRLVAGAVGALVLLGIGRSLERQRVWRNDAVLVARSIRDSPRSFRNQRAFGDLMFEVDQPKLAHEAYDLALRYVPARGAWRVRNSYARAMRGRGELDGAAAQFRLSLAQRADQDFERAELAVTYLALARYADAAAQADSGALHGGRKDIYERLRAIADSAARVHAPPGSIRVGLGRGDARADR